MFPLNIFLSSIEDILSSVLEVYTKLFAFTWSTNKTSEFKFANITFLSAGFCCSSWQLYLYAASFLLSALCRSDSVCHESKWDCGKKQWKSDEFRVRTAKLGMCWAGLLSYLCGSFPDLWNCSCCRCHFIIKSSVLSYMHFI